jgi:MoaA/NifB/PqqE/SkfB family radical SAM enzyme
MELSGEHIPSFLIASVTADCNLRCAGCYDRARARSGEEGLLSRSEWGRVFAEAGKLGVSMILLAGGEPLLRRDVIEEAAEYPGIIFPVFTNGTMIDDELIRIFDRQRNLVPVISIEGGEEQTDKRRGSGVYAQTVAAMQKLRSEGILFGVSITVTAQNADSVTGAEFLDNLQNIGCCAAVFVEYVPVELRELALDEKQSERFRKRLDALRNGERDMILISFPGDEKALGGCLAAGRGFFHINASGGAEPCPFSPYSDSNLKNTTLKAALRSPLFMKLRESEFLKQPHGGGCALFEHEAAVKQLTSQ